MLLSYFIAAATRFQSLSLVSWSVRDTLYISKVIESNSDITATDLIPQEPPKRVKRGCGKKYILLRRKDNPAEHLFIRSRCMTWGCGRCGPWVKRKHLANIGLRFWQSWGAGELIYVLFFKKDRWIAIYKALQRSGAEGRYACLELRNAFCAFSTVATNGAQPLDEVIAMRLLEVLIEALPYDGKRITYGRAWRLEKRESEYELLGWGAVGIETARVIVEGEGLRIQNIDSDWKAGFAFKAPMDYPALLAKLLWREA